MRWLAALKKLLPQPRRPDPRVVLTSDGFTLNDAASGEILRVVTWRHVTRIETYKVDLFTTDCICLLFEQGGVADPIQVSEEWAGFTELFEPLHRAFPDMTKSWYADVMKPAFVENRTVLYEVSANGRRADA
jgi:hypothetical protein